MEATRWRGYFWGYFDFDLGVFFPAANFGGIVALTDTEIRKSKPMEKPYRLPDGGGLFLLVTPAGGKLWRWKYRFEGAEKLMPLGKYPEVPLAQARESGARYAHQVHCSCEGSQPSAK